jgi:hypothetical protein
MSVAMDLDLLDSRRTKQEGSLNADAIGSDPANGEVSLITAIAQADNSTTDELDSLTLAFDNAQMNGDGIARPQLRQILVGRTIE